MDEQQIMAEFISTNAILHGHFILSSGKHSDTYLQCARVLMYPEKANRLCGALIKKLATIIDINTIDMVVAPAMGGLIVGYETARQLNKPFIFCERQSGQFTFRRGFDFPPQTKILVVEDVVTTGLSSKEAFSCIEQHNGIVIAEAALVDRSNGNANLGVPFVSLLNINAQTYNADNLPDELKKIPATKPGSRWLKS